MFRKDLLSITTSLDTVFTAMGICYTSYVDCMLADCQHDKYELTLVDFRLDAQNYYLFIYNLLTPWSRVLLEKLTSELCS
jgi:hypothetical protein